MRRVAAAAWLFARAVADPFVPAPPPRPVGVSGFTPGGPWECRVHGRVLIDGGPVLTCPAPGCVTRIPVTWRRPTTY